MEVLIPIFIFVPLGILVMAAATRSVPAQDRPWLMTLLVVALLLRVACATVFATIPASRVFHEDATGTEFAGMYIASSWRGEAPPVTAAAYNWGPHFLAGFVYYVFGRYQINYSLFNAVLGTVLALLVYKLAKRLFHDLVARRAALLVALMPSMILWGSMALKDVPVTFLIVISLSSCVALKQQLTPLNFFGTFLPLVGVYPLRFYIVYFLVFAIVVALVLDRSLRYLTGIYRQIFLLAAFTGLFVMLGFTDRVDDDASQFISLEYLSRYRRGMATTANSGFDADVDISEPGSALAYLPIGMAHLLLAPFPWQMVSLRPLIAAPETIFWWTLVPATVRGIAISIRKRFGTTSPLLVFSTTVTAVYSLMHGNVGSAFRQRAQILVFLFIFSALGSYARKAKAAGLEPELLLRESGPN